MVKPKSTTSLTAAVEKLGRTVSRRKASANESLPQQSLLLPAANEVPLSPDELALTMPTTSRPEQPMGKRSTLLPARYANRDFFLCDMVDYNIKDDGATMEAPLFSLSTQKDLSTWSWKSKDGKRFVTVTPNAHGRATQFDKDVLIYVISQMTEALNQGRADTKNRNIRFTVYDYLVATNKLTGGAEYKRLENALDRLKGTTIKTNIETGGTRKKESFSIIDSYTIVEKSDVDERMIAVEVVLSKWLFDAVQAHEVLTIDRNYFRLRKPLERRLYELARKHCGQQAMWTIGLALLQEKVGSKTELRDFRRMVRKVIEADVLPEYRLTLDSEKDQVRVYTKSSKKLTASIAKRLAK